jgi:uncharacterized membrane protein
MPLVYLILVALVAIFACYELIHAYREQKKGGKQMDVVLFGIKVVVLMILIGLLMGITNWVMTMTWPEF